MHKPSQAPVSRDVHDPAYYQALRFEAAQFAENIERHLRNLPAGGEHDIMGIIARALRAVCDVAVKVEVEERRRAHELADDILSDDMT